MIITPVPFSLPISFAAGDANLYRYVGNQPVIYVDPSGLDLLDRAANFAAGWADALSLGATSGIRSFAGIDGGIDYSGGDYTAGSYTGTAHSVAIGGGAAVGAYKAARAAAAGKTGLEAIKAVTKSFAGLGGAAQAGNVTKSGLGRLADYGRRALDRLGDFRDATESGSKAVEKLRNGDYAGAANAAFDAIRSLGLPGKGKSKGGQGSESNLGARSSKGAQKSPPTSDYRGRYNAERNANGLPHLPNDYDAHHEIPQRYKNHPEFNDFDFHDPSNIRGVKGSRADVNTHQDITNHWADFAASNPNATRSQIEAFRDQIDSKFGNHWY